MQRHRGRIGSVARLRLDASVALKHSTIMNTKGKIFICGPITGTDLRETYRRFTSKAVELINEGWEVVDPFTVCGIGFADLQDHIDNPRSHDWYMRKTIAALCTCDTIYVLKGWARSKGAMMEIDIACGLNMGGIYEGK